MVTGGASGLGAATVRRLHRAGARVVVLDLPGASEGAEALVRELGGGVEFVPGDVTSWDDMGAAVAAADRAAPLRVAVATAGIAVPGRLFGDGADERFSRTIGVNLVGTFSLLSQAAAAMAAHPPVDGERGVVVCTASVAAYDGQIGQVAYAASKSGVAGMTLPAARELARHLIRVVSIAPGLFDTPMFAGVSEAARASVTGHVPHPSRLGRPDEFASLVGHLVENQMMNGEVVRLDGAIRLPPR